MGFVGINIRVQKQKTRGPYVCDLGSYSGSKGKHEFLDTEFSLVYMFPLGPDSYASIIIGMQVPLRGPEVNNTWSGQMTISMQPIYRWGKYGKGTSKIVAKYPKTITKNTKCDR